MTEKQRFIHALTRQPIEGHVPTFELEFYLTMEALGRVHPYHRSFYQWDQMSTREQELQLNDIADTYLAFVEKYHHSAVLVHPNFIEFDRTVRLLEIMREKCGDNIFFLMLGDPTFAIPNGDDMVAFSCRLFEESEACKQEAAQRVEDCARFAEAMAAHPGLVDGFALCSDYCFNTNPFFSPAMFEEFIAPYLADILQRYRSMGYYTIKHTDGNVMPILDQIVDCRPDAVHSLDPQGGVSLAEVKRLYGDRVSLCGNVNCGLLQTGTDEEVDADVRRALREGMAGSTGYIFCTSNTAYTGMPLERYERMNRIWWEEGIYPARP